MPRSPTPSAARLRRRATHARLALRNIVSGRVQTGCPLLWDSIHVDSDGSVYTCCHSRPFKLGSLYTTTLEEIWAKSLSLRVARCLSRWNRLYCSYACTIVPKARKKDAPYPLSPYPKIISILFSEFCNIDCLMCDQDHHSTKALDVQLLQTRIDWTRIEDVVFQGGEILAQPGAMDMYRWLYTTTRLKPNLITNGTLINDEWATHLVRGSTWVAISVNAATRETHERVNRRSHFDRVVANMQRLIDRKRQTDSGTMIIYKFTIVPENIMEVPEAIALADRLGCDEITFGYSEPVPAWLAEEEVSRHQLVEEIGEAIATAKNIRVETERLGYLGLV
jgi:radical SAM protein with 4Fe4S-binding SPASM domain